MDQCDQSRWRAVLEQAFDAGRAARIAELEAEVAEWRKLRDPVTLHANLIRGLPARLDRDTFLHIAGDEAAPAQQVPEPQPVNAQMLEALRDGLSVCRSIRTGKDRRVIVNDDTMHAQTTEWCKWAEDEVGPKLRAAIAAAEAAQAGSAQQVPAVPEPAPSRADLIAALTFYADGLHFDKASPDAWDTVSGEPQNWWCDEAGTATIEDGSLARMTLRGELTADQINALDEGELLAAAPLPTPKEPKL